MARQKSGSDVRQLVSGARFLGDFINKLVDEVEKRGGRLEQVHRLVTKEGKEALGKFADLIVGAKEAAANIFAVTVDYSRSLSDMIASGKYNWVNSDITQKHFSFPSIPAGLPTKVELNLELVHFNKYISSNDAIAELKQRGMRPATLPELLAFGEKYPEEQRKYPIVALGSIWRGWGDGDVPCLWGSAGGRGLGLRWFEGGWGEYARFAAVRES